MTASVVGADRRSARLGGGVLHAVVVLVLMAVIAALALVVTPPSPPGIAEFAPRATETIDEALKEQASRFGTGEGGDCGAGQSCTAGGAGADATTTTTAPPLSSENPPNRQVIEQAKVKQCVGDPPRQTEDPQSPPCANFWQGDNGGATSRGVSGQEIRVAYPSVQVDIPRFVRHFNTRYQFYGRQIRLVPIQTTDPQAAAVAAEKEAGAFAAFDVQQELQGGPTNTDVYFRELARRKVIGITSQPRSFSLDDMKEMDPYFWSYDLTLEDLQRHTAALVCTLAGRPAAHAGPEVQIKQRKFALIYERGAPSREVLLSGLERCGVTPVQYETDNVVNRRIDRARDMRSREVTSVILLTNGQATAGEMEGASNIGYQPEWILSGLGRVTNETQFQVMRPDQRLHLFGVGAFNRLNPPADEPAYWAAKEGNPDDAYIDGTSTKFDTFYNWYHSFLVLASGIQAAGPNLTPETFAAGLRKTRFANPGAGAAPYWQAHVGFGPGDYTMVDDAVGIWWNDSAPAYRSQQNAAGGWCYVNQGARYRANAWPKVDDQFFNSDRCR